MAPSSSASDEPKRSHKRELSGHICTACDQCYRCKVKCSGEKPECERCRLNKSACTYSKGKPLGKPKGSKNKIQRTKITTPKIASSSGFESSDLQRSGSLKRSRDDDLPPAKRREGLLGPPSRVNTPVNRDGPPLMHHVSEVHQFDPALVSALPSQDVSPLFNESASFLLDDDSTEDGVLQNNNTTIDDSNNIFAAAEATLDFEELKWFGDTGDLGTTPGARSGAEIAPPHVAMSLHDGSKTKYTPPVTHSEIHPTSTPATKPNSFPYFALPCLCDPMSLNIISELQFLQTSLSPLDTALMLARRGFSTVSSSLSCPSCLSSSRSLFYACILIIQQVFTCYGAVKSQGPKMLGNTMAVELPTSHNSVVSIGDFAVEDEDGCNGILDAIVKAEMERGKGVIGGLERWVESSGPSSPKAATLMLRTLREEIGC